MAAQLRLLRISADEKTRAPTLFEASGAVRLMRLEADGVWQTVVKIPERRFLAAESAQGALRLIERELTKADFFLHHYRNWILSIPPAEPAGFSIEIYHQDGPISVQFGGLEIAFESLSEAMPWVSRALSNSYQLRTTEIGKIPRAWYLEPVSGGDPRRGLAMGYAFFERYRQTSTTIRRNSFDP